VKIIYEYIFRELLSPFIFGVGAFVAIFIGTDLLIRLAQYYTEWGLDIITITKMFFLQLPSIIVLSFPMATLLATIIGYSRLSGDSEVTAFRAGGISIYKLVIPALILGLVISILTIGINEVIVPESNYIYNRILNEIRNNDSDFTKTQYHLYQNPIDSKTGRPDYILYAYKFIGKTGEMEDIYLQNFENGKAVTVIQAPRAHWAETDWYFYDGTIYHLREGERVPVLNFEEFKIPQISYTPEQIATIDKKIEDMNLKELWNYIELKSEQGSDTSEEEIEWHQRLSIPFASFIFTLLAAPLGIKPRRSSGSAMGMGLSIIIIFIYYILMMVGSALGGEGAIYPWLGAWIQNIVFLLVGLILLYKVNN
jgi:lipopolysaccharide export system permease protein